MSGCPFLFNFTMTIEFNPLLSNPAESPTLPGHFYSDPQVLKLEKETIFYKHWQLVAHVSQLPNVGSYVTSQIVDQDVIVLRGQSGAIKAFYNVCQHRAHELLSGRGEVKSRIVCPYHAWTYDLNGSLTTARHCDHMPNFAKQDYGLVPVRTEVALGFIFVNLDDNAPSLQSVAGEMFADMQEQCPWITEMVVDPVLSEDSWEGAPLNANWKVLAENCLECYHCAVAHPAFVDLVDLDDYVCQPHDNWLRSYGKLRKYKNKAYDVEPDEPSQNAIFWHLWPNVEFGVVPGEAAIGGFRFYPASSHVTKMTSIMLTKPGESIKEDRINYRWNVLWAEDEAICQSVHRGLQSKGYRQGRFVVDPTYEGISEHAVHYFQLKYAKALGLK